MRASDWTGVIGATGFVAVAALTAFALIMPASGAARMAATALPLAEPHAAAADRALGQKDFATARRESRAELAVSPIREAAWLRLAKIDVAQHQRLTAEGADALSHAYDATPYDLNPQSERITFVLDHFAALPAPLKPSVLDELGAWSASPRLAPALRVAAARAQDPAALAAVRSLSNSQAD